MPSLFLSYRRDDCPDTVKLVHERLKKRLPRWELFYDHDSIPLGEPFPDRLRTQVMAATAVLVIIGPKWLEILRERKDSPVDHVRSEIRLALEGGTSVVPALVGNAAMPTAADLAAFADLMPLLDRNGPTIRPDPHFDADLEPIVAYLKQLDADETIGVTLADKYTLTAEIGVGGMGVVYAAQQKQPVQRMVAVKLIKPGMDSRDVLARFDAERQALAVMDHPNVAKVLDAGMTPSGRPFFVMEYVKGVPITHYCDDKKLTPQERLNLFIPVCNAMQHAHQRGIIHRDLKPSNVLVEVVDGKPVPKVIDFGLAKALGQKLTDKTLHTALDTRVGTLEYSAPEQAAGRSFDVDARSDIYSLGVMLYELLTGAPPFTHEDLLKIGEEEMRRVIREVEPTKPSKKLSSSGELPAIAAKRHLEPNKLMRIVQGDLDWIVMKCLEKENSRRYETANQLGQELQRFLADEPVHAGPPSASYRTKKFLRRNKGLVIMAGLLLVALVTGILGANIGKGIHRPPDPVNEPTKKWEKEVRTPENDPVKEPVYSIKRVSRATKLERDWVGYRGGPDYSATIGPGPEPPLKELWTAKVRVSGPPACVAGRLYVPSGRQVVAIDCITGETLWTSVDLGKITSYPVANAKNVYIGCGPKICALSSDTGEILLSISGEGNCVALLMDGKHLYLTTDNSDVRKVDLAEMRPVWQGKTMTSARGEYHMLFTDDSTDLVFSYCRGRLHALSKQTGETAWKLGSDGSHRSSLPVMYQGLLFAEFEYSQLGVYDGRTGASLGTFRTDSGPYEPWHASYALSDGILYWGDYSSNVVAFDLIEKRMLWRIPKIAGGNGFYQTPAVCSKYAYVIGGDHRLHVLGCEKGTERFILDLPYCNGHISSPIVYRGRLFIPTDGGVICYDTEKRE